MNDIRLFALDLDGTLLNDHKVLSENTIQVLLDYQKKGYQIAIASGRYYKEIERFANMLQLEKYHGYVVCGNGYEVIDMTTNQHHYFQMIDKDIIKDCIQLANSFHLLQYIKIDGTYHLSTNKAEKIIMKGITQLLKKGVQIGIKQISYASHLLSESTFENNLVPYIQNDIVKMCVIGTSANQKKWIRQLKEKYPHYFAYYPVNPIALEITHHSVSKKNAVEYICQQNSLTLDNVMAFGDSGNDEPLLLNCGIGITMKNGTHQALKKARIISDYSNHEDGVVKAIQKYVEI
ncbi:MAG: HAD family hydrolase [Traorella sp.]